MLNKIALVSVFAAVLSACGGAEQYKGESEVCPSEGLRVEVEGDAFCVFIEEGFLSSDCPPDYPYGEEIDGVVVCSASEEIPREEVSEALEEEGISAREMRGCEDVTDCPNPILMDYCDGDVAVSPAPVSAFCEEGQCGIETATRGDIRTDCTTSGQICQRGVCVDNGDGACSAPNPQGCRDDGDCGEEEACLAFQDVCLSSSCICMDDGTWTCTPDCGGGSCYEVASGPTLEVVEAHQRCDSVDDCVAVKTGCGDCEGDCAGVGAEYLKIYESGPACEDYTGPICDVSCMPSSGLTELVCEDNRCAIKSL